MTTELTQDLIKEVKENISGEKEIELENHTISILKDLKEKGAISDEEIKTVYETNFQKLVSWNTENKEITDTVLKLKSVENKLLAVSLQKNKESSNSNWVRNRIYDLFDIDKNIGNNSKTQNIGKWIIDELMSIPELLAEIVNPKDWFKNAREFAKGLYEALVKNFAQTMKSIMDSFTDAFKGTDTPEKAYKTWRSSVLIILTLFPGAIGKSLLKVGKLSGKLAKWVVKWTVNITKKAAKWAVELTSKAGKSLAPELIEVNAKIAAKNAAKKAVKNAPKNINNTIMVGAEKQWILNGTKKMLNELKWQVVESKIVQNSKNIGSKWINYVGKWIEKTWKWINYVRKWTYLGAGLETIIKMPIRLANWLIIKPINFISSKFHLAFSKDLKNIAKWQREIILKQKILAKYTPWDPLYSSIQHSIKQLELNSTFAKDVLKKNMKTKYIWAWVIAVNEVDDIVEQVTSDKFMEKIWELMNEENNKMGTNTEKTVNLASWVTEISEDSLNYPQLEWIDRNVDQDKLPTINITWLASKTWSYEINQKISQKRAEKAKEIIKEKYNIPDSINIQITTDIQPEDNTDDISQWQWVRVEIWNIPDPTYVEWYDETKKNYKKYSESYNTKTEELPDN